MNKLVRNELYKIFHKKGIYILLIITCGLALLSAVLSSVLDDSLMNSMVIPVARQSLEVYDVNKPDEAAAYVELKLEVDKYDLMAEIGFKSTSPEYYYLQNVVAESMRKFYNEKYIKKDEVAAEEAQKELDAKIETLKHFDWKQYVNERIEEVKANEALSENVKKEVLRSLQYRLDHNLPYKYSQASNDLDSYAQALLQYETMEKDESRYFNRDALLQKREIESEVEIGKYKLDNNLIKDYGDSGTAQDAVLSVFGNASIFLLVCILMIAGTIVAEEFNKGTIKQLLTRPYCRSKILVSKIIATFITIVAYVLVYAIFLTLVTGITTGSFGSLLDPVLYYNFNSHSVVALNTVLACLLSFAGILPQIIILTLFTILISTLTGNTSVSVILGFILTFMSELFLGFVSKVKILSLWPTFNWDLNVFFFGGIHRIEAFTFTKAIIVDIVTVIVLTVVSLIVFKRKDIKNQ